MRVAHFIQRYPPALGGSEAYFHRLGHFLAGRGDDVTVWTTNAIDLEAFWSPRGRCLPAGVTDEAGVHVRRYAVAGRIRGRRWLLKPLSLLPLRPWQCLTLPCNPVAPGMWRDAGRSSEHFDVVHATAFPYAWPVVCGLRLARRLGVPFLLTPFLHLGDPTDPADRTRRQYTSPPLRWLLRAADRVFVQTDGEQNAVRDLGVPPDRIVRQGLGVDVQDCTGGDRRRARARWRVADDAVVIGHLANNSVEKGSVDLLRAAERLWQRGITFELVLAGPEMPNFRRFGAGYPFIDRVRRCGLLSEADKRDFFAGIDVFALPSRSDSFGLVLLEAWANGRPNVVYRAGGPADLVRHELDGLQAACGDVAGLAGQLGRLIADADLRRALGETGRARVGREFRWADRLELVRNELERLAATRSPRSGARGSAALRSA
ncbi:MAG TPA: glycosyltransferase family 4 protein, partial [Gemmataceae bacterium]